MRRDKGHTEKMRDDMTWLVNHVIYTIQRIKRDCDCSMLHCSSMSDMWAELDALERSLPEYLRRTIGELDTITPPHQDVLLSTTELRELRDGSARKYRPDEAPTLDLLPAWRDEEGEP